MGGVIVFGNYPSSKLSQEAKYISHLCVIVIISFCGVYYQRKQLQDLDQALKTNEDLG